MVPPYWLLAGAVPPSGATASPCVGSTAFVVPTANVGSLPVGRLPVGPGDSGAAVPREAPDGGPCWPVPASERLAPAPACGPAAATAPTAPLAGCGATLP